MEAKLLSRQIEVRADEGRSRTSSCARNVLKYETENRPRGSTTSQDARCRGRANGGPGALVDRRDRRGDRPQFKQEQVTEEWDSRTLTKAMRELTDEITEQELREDLQT